VDKLNVKKLKIYNIVMLPSVTMAMVWVILDYDEIFEPRFAIQPSLESSKKGPNYVSLCHWGSNGGNSSHYSKEASWLAITS